MTEHPFERILMYWLELIYNAPISIWWLNSLKFTTDHIHLKSKDAIATSDWYVQYFDAKITEQVDWPNMLNISLDLGGVRLNVSQQKDNKLTAGTSEMRLGLEHFGIKTENLNAVWSLLTQRKAYILSPIRILPNKTRIFFRRRSRQCQNWTIGIHGWIRAQ